MQVPSDKDFLKVVENAPLVAIDLLVLVNKRLLVGFRVNEPAKGTWFVPGGRIRKDENIPSAFVRISTTELGRAFHLHQSVPAGLYEHFYDTNFMGAPMISTHYIVMAQALMVNDLKLDSLPRVQHTDYRLIDHLDLQRDPAIHKHTKMYGKVLETVFG